MKHMFGLKLTNIPHAPAWLQKESKKKKKRGSGLCLTE